MRERETGKGDWTECIIIVCEENLLSVCRDDSQNMTCPSFLRLRFRFRPFSLMTARASPEHHIQLEKEGTVPTTSAPQTWKLWDVNNGGGA